MVPQASWLLGREAVGSRESNKSLGSARALFERPNMANEPRNSCVNNKLPRSPRPGPTKLLAWLLRCLKGRVIDRKSKKACPHVFLARQKERRGLVRMRELT